jgi:predicted nucleic acid-binding protein
VNLIVDASVAFKWLVAEHNSDVALLLRRDHDLLAPDLLLIECRNAALSRFRRGELTLEQAIQVDRELPTMQLRIFPSLPLLSDAFAIAAEIRHAIYDCIYVAAAIATNRLLVTADERFAAKLAISARAATRIRTLESFAR